MCVANADRASVGSHTHFIRQAISDLTPPEGPTGLIIVNPPYGGRIGDTKKLMPLYQALGNTLNSRFKGWRVGIVTNSADLVRATGLSFVKRTTAFSHGGIPVKLYKTLPLQG
nr:hypothetical protein [Kordiimonas gwangyangensis]